MPAESRIDSEHLESVARLMSKCESSADNIQKLVEENKQISGRRLKNITSQLRKMTSNLPIQVSFCF